MTQPRDVPRTDASTDIARVTGEITDRLRARGVSVYDADSPEDIVEILEAVEEFERAVEARGGDLFVDEPPPNRRGEPDDRHFLLPRRSADESATAYLSRLTIATRVVQEHKPIS
jgi:hypothetical protein